MFFKAPHEKCTLRYSERRIFDSAAGLDLALRSPNYCAHCTQQPAPFWTSLECACSSNGKSLPISFLPTLFFREIRVPECFNQFRKNNLSLAKICLMTIFETAVHFFAFNKQNGKGQIPIQQFACKKNPIPSMQRRGGGLLVWRTFLPGGAHTSQKRRKGKRIVIALSVLARPLQATGQSH